jgi:hypothetical protein
MMQRLFFRLKLYYLLYPQILAATSARKLSMSALRWLATADKQGASW